MEVQHRHGSRRDRIFRYQMRVYESELIRLRKEKEDILKKIGLRPTADISDIPNIPSFYDAVKSPFILALLTRMQELFWTLRRLGIGRADRTIPGRSAPAATRPPSMPRPIDANPRSGTASTLYIDTTSTLRGCVGGGIARVCERIITESHGLPGVRPVAIVDGRLHELDTQRRPGPVASPGPGDTYLILDAFWEPFEDYLESLRQARAAGARTVLCVHDVIPLLLPGLVDGGIPAWFSERLQATLDYVDLIVSVSRSSAREIRRVVKYWGLKKRVVWFHLGHDAFAGRDQTQAAGSGTRQFLSIGTIEPKKGYMCALDAFDTLWDQGHDVRYVIIGKAGWAAAALIERIEQHPELGRRLIWLKSASDADIQAAFASSYCFLQASIAEGFGLPIVEAAASGLPVIASDLPVFREIAGDRITYFPVCDSVALAELLKQVLTTRPAPAALPSQTWAQSTRALVAVLGGAASPR